MKIEIKILNKKLYPSCYPGNIYTGIRTLESIQDNNYFLEYATPGSAAVDLICPEDVTIYPGETKTIYTGLAMWIGSKPTEIHFGSDFSVAGLIIPRSSLGTKGLVIANTVGLIDEDYQGELIVHVWNRLDKIKSYDYETNEVIISEDFIELKKGDRFAQLVFVPVIKTQWQIVEEFSRKTNRGEGGFGSTGE